jgi:hypothetical protein
MSPLTGSAASRGMSIRPMMPQTRTSELIRPIAKGLPGGCSGEANASLGCITMKPGGLYGYLHGRGYWTAPW